MTIVVTDRQGDLSVKATFRARSERELRMITLAIKGDDIGARLLRTISVGRLFVKAHRQWRVQRGQSQMKVTQVEQRRLRRLLLVLELKQKGLSYQEIGERFAMGSERIRQLHKQAMMLVIP